METLRDSQCRACSQITSGDCGMHGPRIIPTAFGMGGPTQSLPESKPAPVAALREMVELSEQIGFPVSVRPAELRALLRRLDRAEAVVQEVEPVLVQTIAALEQTQRYALVMLGVDADGNGPGESVTPAAQQVSIHLASAKAALETVAAYRAEGEEVGG